VKVPPRRLGPKFEAGEYLDLVRNDVQRRANESKRKKYDSADSMESAEKAIAFTSGEGDANNTFFASAGASGGAAKRQKIN